MSMVKTISKVVVDGFGSGETDFLTRLSQSSEQVQQDFQTLIIAPLVRVVTSDAMTAVLRVEGHSDRVDTPGLSREQRRLQELQASVDRANSATDGTYQVLEFESPIVLPPDWAEVAQAAVMPVALGGSNLLFSSDSLSDPERRANRRVVLQIAWFEFFP